MGVATAPPIRLDLSLRANDDRPVGVLWVAADQSTPVAATSGTFTFRFDLPDDDLWELDVDGVPIEPERQIVTVPAEAGGLAAGQIAAVITHELWETVETPWRGTWDVVAVSGAAVQRCLARGEFTCEQGADA